MYLIKNAGFHLKFHGMATFQYVLNIDLTEHKGIKCADEKCFDSMQTIHTQEKLNIKHA